MIVFHAFIGLWTVGTDYLTRKNSWPFKSSLIKYADLIRNLYFLCFGLMGFIYLI